MEIKSILLHLKRKEKKRQDIHTSAGAFLETSIMEYHRGSKAKNKPIETPNPQFQLTPKNL